MVGYQEHELLDVITCDACLNNCDECELVNTGPSTICLDQQCETGYGIDDDRMCIGRLRFICVYYTVLPLSNNCYYSFLLTAATMISNFTTVTTAGTVSWTASYCC